MGTVWVTAKPPAQRGASTSKVGLGDDKTFLRTRSTSNISPMTHTLPLMINLSQLLQGKGQTKVKLPENDKVRFSRIYLGHPNFYFRTVAGWVSGELVSLCFSSLTKEVCMKKVPPSSNDFSGKPNLMPIFKSAASRAKQSGTEKSPCGRPSKDCAEVPQAWVWLL